MSTIFKTLFKETENAGQIMELYQDSWGCLDKSLPYWCLLQAIGHEGVVERIKHANSLTKAVVDTINNQQPFLKIIVTLNPILQTLCYFSTYWTSVFLDL